MSQIDYMHCPLEQLLGELSKQMKEKAGIDLYDYYALLRWAKVWVLVPEGHEENEAALGLEWSGISYQALFLNEDLAMSAGKKLGNYKLAQLEAHFAMTRVKPKTGFVIDWSADSEIRISPEEVLELNELYGIWRIKHEATEEWIFRTLETVGSTPLSPHEKLCFVVHRWVSLNGLPLAKNSRRFRRISQITSAFQQGDSEGFDKRLEAIWQANYASTAYLHFLSKKELFDRQKAIQANLFFSDRQALPHELTDIEWREKHFHVVQELKSRGLNGNETFDLSGRWPRLEKAEKAYESYSGPWGELFRFCKREYLEPLLESGALTLFPVTRFKDDTLLPAQQDDELSRTKIFDGTKRRAFITDISGVTHEVPLVGSLSLSTTIKTNYYAWYTSTTFDPRLFDDFHKDACLIIHDSTAFSDRLIKSVDEALGAWMGNGRLIRYFDPLDSDDLALSTQDKDFRFAYQREYRFNWLPNSKPAHELKPIEVSLGPLTDIASLIWID